MRTDAEDPVRELKTVGRREERRRGGDLEGSARRLRGAREGGEKGFGSRGEGGSLRRRDERREELVDDGLNIAPGDLKDQWGVPWSANAFLCHFGGVRTNHSSNEVEGAQSDTEVGIVDALEDLVLVVLKKMRVCRDDLHHRQKGDIFDYHRHQ